MLKLVSSIMWSKWSHPAALHSKHVSCKCPAAKSNDSWEINVNCKHSHAPGMAQNMIHHIIYRVISILGWCDWSHCFWSKDAVPQLVLNLTFGFLGDGPSGGSGKCQMHAWNCLDYANGQLCAVLTSADSCKHQMFWNGEINGGLIWLHTTDSVSLDT